MQGELTTSEEQRLLAHVRQCAVCRLERLARQDFRREAEDPEADLYAHRLVAALIVPTSLQEGLRQPVRSRMRHLRVALIAAAMVSVAGWAAAARWSGAPWTGSAHNAQNPTPARNERASADGQPPGHVGDVVPSPAPSPPDTLGESSAVPPAPAVVSPSLSRVERRIARAQPAPLPLAPPREPANPVLSPPDAATLFGRATDARRLGDHAGAAHLYRALIEDFPSSSEAHEALALLGRLLLDDTDAEGALRCFERYLATGGALREDVMLGRALSLRRLGRIPDETRAWTELVAEYPSSVHAERARRRLLDLASP